jgi:hypothetical protein
MKKQFTTVILQAALVAAVATGLGAAGRLLAQDKVTLKVVKVDSEETSGEDGKGANAVDGNPETFWHTQWQDATPGHPHEIIIELSRACQINGFTYLPRQDGGVNGTIKNYEFYVSEDGKEFGDAVKKGALDEGNEKKTVNFAARRCKFIKLRALSEVNGEAWTSAAEIGIVEATDKAGGKTAGKPKLKFIRVDSQESEGEDGKGSNAVDGDPETFWHTQWQDANPPHPHEILIELEPPCKIKGFTYLPRQDEGVNGGIKDYEFYVSDDGKDFGEPVKKGSFGEGKAKQTATFDAKQCHFFKLKALSEINGEAWTSAAEIDVIPE